MASESGGIVSDCELPKLDAATEEKEFGSHKFALYTYNAHRRFDTGDELNSRNDNDAKAEGSVADFLRKEAKTNQDFSLSVLSTDLPGEQETEVRTFIAQRLSRGTVYSGNGHIATLDSLLAGENHICYYCVLRGCKVEKEATSSEEFVSKDFVLCLISHQDSGIDLFQKELDDYSQRLLPQLEKCLESSDVKEQYKHLELWFDENIKFVCRCVSLFKEKLSVLIQCGLLGLKLHIQGADTQLENDIAKFVDACGSGSVSALSSSHECLKTETTPVLKGNIGVPTDVSLTVRDTEFLFSCEETTEFCRKWAQTMMTGDVENPVFLRQVIDNYKLRVNHDLNTLKRLLRQAETDHYALYRSYEFLQKCGNGAILLRNAALEAQTLSSVDTLNIVKVLQEYIAENAGQL